MSLETPRDYKIIQLPVIGRDALSSGDEGRLIDRYRTFRLSGLQNDPEAFASSYEGEVNQPRDFWTQRLSNPTARHFVAVVSRDNDAKSSLEAVESERCGTVVMLGPTCGDEGHAPTANQSPWTTAKGGRIEPAAPTATESRSAARYHLAGMFISSHHRRNGLGKALLRQALAVANEHCQQQRVDLCVDVYADTVNPGAIALYKASGFTIIAEEVYQPAATNEGPRPEKKAYLMRLEKSVGLP